MPHLDEHERIERAHVSELSQGARAKADRAENEARIREQIEGAPRRGCKRCGDPYAAINLDGRCDLCERDAQFDGARDKLGPEELYPEHFPDSNENE